MFDYSRAALGLIVDDLRKLIRAVSFILSIGIYAYLVTAIFLNIGYLAANIALLAVKAIYDMLSLVLFRNKTCSKTKRKIVKRGYTWTKLGINFITIGLSMVNMAIFSTEVKPIAIVCTTLLIIVWVLQVLFEIVTFIFEQKSRLLIAGIQRDVRPIKNTLNSILDLLNIGMNTANKEEIDIEEVYKKECARLDKIVPKDSVPKEYKISINPLDIVKKTLFKKRKKDNADTDEKVG